MLSEAADASIRAATAGDASAIAALWTAAYACEGGGGRTAPYGEADFFDTARRGEVFVAEQRDSVFGVVALLGPDAPGRAVAQGSEAELSRLAVVRSARGQGVGGALVDLCEERARAQSCEAIALWTRRYQTAAHRIYESRGYRREPQRDSVDESGHARLVFRLGLT